MPLILLDYGRADLPSDARREMDAIADAYGGWHQIAAGLTWAAFSAGSCFILLGEGAAGIAVWGSLIGLTIGLFRTPPRTRGEWAKLLLWLGSWSLSCLAVRLSGLRLVIPFVWTGYFIGMIAVSWRASR